ncbi:MAG: hypothetical protein EXR77_19360 [Myxococcales bacterium]|nr:hypothetical protein [Myxococcales bacterium]
MPTIQYGTIRVLPRAVSWTENFGKGFSWTMENKEGREPVLDVRSRRFFYQVVLSFLPQQNADGNADSRKGASDKNA